MAANMMACPNIWPGEEQPSLLDQEASLSLSNQAADSEPCLPVRAEQPAHGSSQGESRPPRSKSKGELVIVINERLKNGECDRRAAVTIPERQPSQLLNQLSSAALRPFCPSRVR